MTLPYRSVGWKTARISPTCEQMEGTVQQPAPCGKPTDYAYPSHSTGWCALCAFHARKHHPHIFPIERVIASGEKFQQSGFH